MKCGEFHLRQPELMLKRLPLHAVEHGIEHRHKVRIIAELGPDRRQRAPIVQSVMANLLRRRRQRQGVDPTITERADQHRPVAIGIGIALRRHHAAHDPDEDIDDIHTHPAFASPIEQADLGFLAEVAGEKAMISGEILGSGFEAAQFGFGQGSEHRADLCRAVVDRRG